MGLFSKKAVELDRFDTNFPLTDISYTYVIMCTFSYYQIKHYFRFKNYFKNRKNNPFGGMEDPNKVPVKYNLFLK